MSLHPTQDGTSRPTRQHATPQSMLEAAKSKSGRHIMFCHFDVANLFVFMYFFL